MSDDDQALQDEKYTPFRKHDKSTGHPDSAQDLEPYEEKVIAAIMNQ